MAAASLARMRSNKLVDTPLSGPLAILLGESGAIGVIFIGDLVVSTLNKFFFTGDVFVGVLIVLTFIVGVVFVVVVVVFVGEQ